MVYAGQIRVKISAHTVYLCVLCGSQNKQSLLPYTTLTDWFSYTKTECVHCAVRTGYLNIIPVSLVPLGLPVLPTYISVQYNLDH